MADEPPPLDPTKNVIDNLQREIKRQDDLREGAKELWESKFEGMRRELDKSERQRIEQKTDNEKAFAKSEAAATEQARQQNETLTARLASVSSDMANVKEGLNRIENVKAGSDEHKSDQRANIGMIVGIAGVAFGLLSLAISIITVILAINGNGS